MYLPLSVLSPGLTSSSFLHRETIQSLEHGAELAYAACDRTYNVQPPAKEGAGAGPKPRPYHYLTLDWLAERLIICILCFFYPLPTGKASPNRGLSF